MTYGATLSVSLRDHIRSVVIRQKTKVIDIAHWISKLTYMAVDSAISDVGLSAAGIHEF